ncbi:hypothetical protein WG907_04250 [Sphingobium sp. AN558]|uniref:hypothetical protein n=1 Tax=Sphingobium sp. AN558 TaxID=3133442 RepID=UPI0030C261FF
MTNHKNPLIEQESELTHAHRVVGEMLDYFDSHRLATWAPLAEIVIRERENARLAALSRPQPAPASVEALPPNLQILFEAGDNIADYHKGQWGLKRVVVDAAKQELAALTAQAHPAGEGEAMREALEPFLREIDRLEKEYGFDRPLHQGQCMMLPLSALLNLKAAAGAGPSACLVPPDLDGRTFKSEPVVDALDMMLEHWVQGTQPTEEEGRRATAALMSSRRSEPGGYLVNGRWIPKAGMWAKTISESDVVIPLYAHPAGDDGIKAALADPVAVHANMLRGTIARPDVRSMIHIYGETAVRNALPAVEGEAVAWMYEAVTGSGAVTFYKTRSEYMARQSPPHGEWTETPLYAHPAPASDVREALSDTILAYEEAAYACSSCQTSCGPVKAVNEIHSTATKALSTPPAETEQP